MVKQYRDIKELKSLKEFNLSNYFYDEDFNIYGKQYKRVGKRKVNLKKFDKYNRVSLYSDDKTLINVSKDSLKQLSDKDNLLDKNKKWIKIPDNLMPTKGGYEYYVSDYGDVFRMPTLSRKGEFVGSSTGEPPCYGHISIDSGHAKIYVHRLVYSLFVNEIPEGMYINHKDGNPKNNHVNNLEVCTPSQNIRHAFDTGLIKRKYKLSKQEIDEINYKYQFKIYTARELANEYDCSIPLIYKVVSLNKNKLTKEHISETIPN